MKVRFLTFLLVLNVFSISLGAQSVGLVLSGGGAKGLSHVGVIKALEENNIPIDYICGTSMGAIVGGLYAIGLSPDEMLALFRSPEFEAWYKGMPEQAYASYFYRNEATPEMFTFSFAKKEESGPVPADQKKKSKWKISLPTSLVSPYSMDLAVMQIFVSPSVAAGGNFDSLMTPFFCVASDIVRKKPYILKNGNLGAAVRASMTYPFYFKPITIDSTLLFDGGFYNNFPWDIMEKEYHPDYIIGAKCVTGEMKLDEDDVFTQVSNMLMVQTDYGIPPEKGMVIERKYPYGIMDFHKVDEIVELGYKNALSYIAALREKIKKERTVEQVDSMRLAFRKQCREVVFDSDIEVSDNLSRTEQHFITRTIRDDKMEDLDFEKFKRGYYRVVASKQLKTFYPFYQEKNDSLLTLKIKATKASPWSVSIGGNISSSSLNQGFLGMSYQHMARNPWKISSGINMGKYYKGGFVSWRHDIGVRPLAYYSAELTVHQFDYYNGNQNLFASDKLPGNIQRMEYFGRVNVATPLAIKKNILLRFCFVAGGEYYKYYQVDNYTSYDIPDKTYIALISPMIGLERNTQNYALYPTLGKKEQLLFRYNYTVETFKSGTTSPSVESYDNKKHNMYLGRVYTESYFKISKWLHMGYLADLTVSDKNNLGDYISTMLYMPAFKPVPHNNTLIMEHYRANSYLGVGISPVFLFTKTLFLHTNVSWFQPYKQIYRVGNGGYEYSDAFPRGAFIANAALVWQSPIGPISFATTYYEKGEYNWYPQFNIGFLIFKKKALDY